MKNHLLIIPVLLLAGCANNPNKCDKEVFSAQDVDKTLNVSVCINNNKTASISMTRLADGVNTLYESVPISDVRYLHSKNNKSEFNALFLKGPTPFMIIDEVKTDNLHGHWSNIDMYKDKNLKHKEIMHLDTTSVKHKINDTLYTIDGIKELAVF